MLDTLDAEQVRRWAVTCVQSLGAHREAIDRINVYPVPDSDTGSNLWHTMRAALDALLRAPGRTRTDVGAAMAELARGALAGARGNSGVIVSQLLRGLADALRGADGVTGAELRAALARGAELAGAAMAKPVSGTMLSVLDAAAAAAREAEHDTLPEVIAAAVAAAERALAETPRQLAVLAAAGVVDAGGQGVVVLLDALRSVVTEQPAATLAVQRDAAASAALAEHGMYTSRESGSDAYAYEVMYLLSDLTADTADTTDAADDSVSRLRDRLDGLGDSVSVVGDGNGLWTVHVHSNDVGAAIEAGVETGRPSQIRVARFADAPVGGGRRFARDRAVVVPVRSSGLADLLARENVAVFLADADATAYGLLEVITGTGAAHVAVLPADPGLMEIADEASIRAVAAGQDVVVVPCASPVQVLAAVAVHDTRRRAGDDVVAMAEAAAATRRGEVVVAEQAAITWIGPCAAGDVLGFADGEVVLIEPGPPEVDALDRAVCGVVGRMLTAGGELVTALLGAGVPDDLANELADYLRREHPEAELVVYDGGQTNSVIVLGVE